MSVAVRLRASEPCQVPGTHAEAVTGVTVGAVDPVQLLARYARGIDLNALAAAVGDEMTGDLLDRAGPVPAQTVTLWRAQFTDLLAAAATNGVARFIAAAELSTVVDGTLDESAVALERTVETVRTALTGICAPADGRDQAERARLAAEGVHLLLQLVNSYDEAKA